MRVLVTGSSGHLGEALMRALPEHGHSPRGLDLRSGPYTDHVGSVTDPSAVASALAGAEAVIHAATLHKPHVATHSRQDFVDTNITGTLTVLEAARAQGVARVVFTSTTSAFGAALSPPPGAPAAWIDESVTPVPKNIYGTTKAAAEDLCQLFARRFGLDIVVLRTARFFPEADDDAETRAAYDDDNAKANEFLYRRLDLADAVTAHALALERAPEIGWGRYILSATTPFVRADSVALGRDAPALAAARVPRLAETYAARGWRVPPRLDRVYDNAAARAALGWRPEWDIAAILAQAQAGAPLGSPLARSVGAKGYHDQTFAEGPYPVAPA